MLEEVDVEEACDEVEDVEAVVVLVKVKYPTCLFGFPYPEELAVVVLVLVRVLELVDVHWKQVVAPSKAQLNVPPSSHLVVAIVQFSMLRYSGVLGDIMAVREDELDTDEVKLTTSQVNAKIASKTQETLILTS